VLKMWKYRHSVKGACTSDRQPGSCRPHSVCVNENTDNVEDLVFSQEDNPKTHRLNLRSHVWHSLTDCTQNNLSRSTAQLCQTTSRTAAVWNQSHWTSDSLQAAAV